MSKGKTCMSRWRSGVWRSESLAECRAGCARRAKPGDGCEWDGKQTCGLTVDCDGIGQDGPKRFEGFAGTCRVEEHQSLAPPGQNRLVALRQLESQLQSEQKQERRRVQHDLHEAMAPNVPSQQRLEELKDARKAHAALLVDRKQLRGVETSLSKRGS
jgi:hypothetical protein